MRSSGEAGDSMGKHDSVKSCPAVEARSYGNGDGAKKDDSGNREAESRGTMAGEQRC